MKNLCFFVTGITVAVSNLPTFYTGDSVCHFRRQTKNRPSVVAALTRRSATNGATGARSGHRVPRRERAGTGRAGRCHAFPPADGRREGEDAEHAAGAIERPSGRASVPEGKFRIPLSRSNRSPRTRGLLARRRRASPGPTPARPVADSPPTSNPRFRVRSAHTPLPSLSRPDRGDPHDGGPARGEG